MQEPWGNSTRSSQVIDFDNYAKTKKRTITRRGVLWLGQTCNIRCHFCYFLDRIAAKEHPEHPFMDLEKAKTICGAMRHVYDNVAVDIQGGEPTIYRGIEELIAYCRDIGLQPTLITNAITLRNKDQCRRLKAAGLRDFLVSIQGLGEVYDRIAGTKDGAAKQLQALENFREENIPFRFNTVLSKLALPQYTDIARLAVESGARAVNFLAFNPFEDQTKGGTRSIENVARYSDVAVELNKALDILEEGDVEANVRYIPICMVEPRHRKSMFNFQQLSYDNHEWDFASWSWTGEQPQRMKWQDVSPLVSLEAATHGQARNAIERLVAQDLLGLEPRVIDQERDRLYRENARLRSFEHCKNFHAPACQSCAAQPICDGFHRDYGELFGTDEARPITDLPRLDDPTYFIRDQWKVVEPEDYHWAL